MEMVTLSTAKGKEKIQRGTRLLICISGGRKMNLHELFTAASILKEGKKVSSIGAFASLCNAQNVRVWCTVGISIYQW